MTVDEEKFLSAEPAWLSKATAEALPYPGADTRPTYDSELPLLSEDETPSLGIRTRYLEVARLKALGRTNNEVCEILGYTPSWMSTVLNHPFIQAEITRYRDVLYDQDVASALRDIAKDGARVLHETLLDPTTKPDLRSLNARWAIEKVTGKAKQEVSVESNTLSEYMRLMREMNSRGESLKNVSPRGVLTEGLGTAPDVIDVKAAPAEGGDRWTAWLDSELDAR